MKRLCAHCVENEAVIWWGKYKLCVFCRDYAIKHGKLDKDATPKITPRGRSSEYGGGGYKPNLDEIGNWYN